MSIIDDLKQEVAKNREVTSSATKLLELLTARIQTAVSDGDLPKLQEILNEVKADTSTLADAVAANTPAEPGVQPPVDSPSSESVAPPVSPSAPTIEPAPPAPPVPTDEGQTG